MVTHSSTSRPVQCLCMAERTGCPVFTDLWSYVILLLDIQHIKNRLLGRLNHNRRTEDFDDCDLITYQRTCRAIYNKPFEAPHW